LAAATATAAAGAGGWWLVAGGWWLVAGGWWLLLPLLLPPLLWLLLIGGARADIVRSCSVIGATGFHE
jgi:hypothetical protein